MSNEDKVQYEKKLMKKLEITKEYKEWQESLFAIIGFISKEIDDDNLLKELMADHLNNSVQLQIGLEKAKYYTSKEEQEQWFLDGQ
ncbi:MAG: hypothetical protein LLF83_05200 [Methanobacterium sp.]|nr:hypothetical protein [Methanobacterium sp.]